MTQNNKKPAIRFKGFTDDWEQRKLNQVCSYVSSSLTSSSSITNGKYDLYDATSVIGTVNSFHMEENYITVIKDGAGVGRIRKLPKNTAFIGTMGALVSKFNDINFLYYLLEKKDLSKEFSGSTIPHIYFKDYGNDEIYTTTFQEQIKIGGFLELLENHITLHQHKYSKLVNIKKALLEKMFPSNGQRTPEIRFRGFTDDWEQHKLEEIAPLRGGYAFKSSLYKESGVPIVRISNILSNGSIGGDFIYYSPINDDTNFVLHNDDAVLAMSGATTGKVAIINTENNQKMYQNQRVGFFTRKEDVDYSFVSTIVMSDLFMAKLKNVLVAGAQPNVSSKNIDSFAFDIPKNISEQEFIGTFFMSLDTLITLHQRKCEKLKNIKKSLLDKMFI